MTLVSPKPWGGWLWSQETTRAMVWKTLDQGKKHVDPPPLQFKWLNLFVFIMIKTLPTTLLTTKHQLKWLSVVVLLIENTLQEHYIGLDCWRRLQEHWSSQEHIMQKLHTWKHTFYFFVKKVARLCLSDNLMQVFVKLKLTNVWFFIHLVFLGVWKWVSPHI